MNAQLVASGKRYKIFESRDGYDICSRKSTPYIDGNRNVDGVSIIAHDKGGYYAIVKQFRNTINKWIYEFPAGKLDDGESIIRAAKRELREETGLNLYTGDENDVDIKIGFPTVGFTDEQRAVVFGTCIGQLSTKHLVGDEKDKVEPLLLDMHDLEELMEDSNNQFDLLILGFVMGSKYGCFI